jgi:hypothetical protein
MTSPFNESLIESNQSHVRNPLESSFNVNFDTSIRMFFVQSQLFAADDWGNDNKMAAMFEPFPDEGGDVNSASHDRKMAFWSSIIRRWCLAKHTAAFSVRQVAYEFERNGQMPECLSTVVKRMTEYETAMFPLISYSKTYTSRINQRSF